MFLKFFDVASGCDALIRQFSAQCQMSKICFSTHTDVGDNMLMIMMKYLPGGDRVGENVDEDVDDHCQLLNICQVGIECVHHLPGVGSNLQDHLEM